MKKLVCALATAGVLFTLNAAYADDACMLQGTAVPVSQIQSSISAMTGYTLVKTIKLNDDCVYKAKVKDASGQEWKLFFDPMTGNLLGKSKD